jgi:nucleotide-binding universal stress UspA family protein
MMQHILVGLDGSDDSENALQYGIALAKSFQATLHGLHVIDVVQAKSPLLYDLAGATGAAPQFNLTALMQENLEYRGQQLMTQFRQACEAESVPGVEHVVTGVIASEITRMAQEMDLVLIGREGVHTGLSKSLLGSTAISVVRSGVKPTMVVTQPFREICKPLLATDGSPAAMAALSTAIAFVRLFDVPLSVVHCASSREQGNFLEVLKGQVKAEGIDCQVAIHQGNAHEDLVQYVREKEYDLLFMGAFGNRRIVEWILGSTTQYLLQTSPVPLVLCHEQSVSHAV